MPRPRIVKTGDKYELDQGDERSIGKVSAFLGTAAIVLRAYAWVMNLGPAGLREVSEIAVLNNNYIMGELLKVKGMSAPYAKGKHRIEQVRYSWEELAHDTGISSGEIGIRAADFGTHYWTSHHPYIVPEPVTIEPTESYSRTDLDEYVQIMRHISAEAYATPDVVRSAPHNCPIHKVDDSYLDDPKRWSITWRAWKRKLAEHKAV